MTEVREQVVDRARGMRDLVRAEAAESERLRTLSTRIVDEMWASGLMSAFTPAAAGGVEPSFQEMIDTWIEMAWQDGSFGWIGIANLPSTFAAATYLPDEGFAEIFTKNENRVTIGGQYFPNGQGAAVDGGYRLNGAWNFGSGTGHSAYIGAGFFPRAFRTCGWHFCLGRRSPSLTDGMSRGSRAPAPTITTLPTCSCPSTELCRCSLVSLSGEIQRPAIWA
ncbi:MAG: hypothetical protein QOG75_90 [Mycobacterium sp.]|jgi:hypothetical protein|nr:hypothetical protein [Mycobacterium sp.]